MTHTGLELQAKVKEAQGCHVVLRQRTHNVFGDQLPQPILVYSCGCTYNKHGSGSLAREFDGVTNEEAVCLLEEMDPIRMDRRRGVYRTKVEGTSVAFPRYTSFVDAVGNTWLRWKDAS